MAKLILGSQSPRRKEILGFFSLPFDQKSPSFDEESIPFNDNPEEFVCILSSGKAKSLSRHYPDHIILTADTIVYKEGRIFGKPATEDEAFQTLSELVGKWHTVYTGITVKQGRKEISKAEPTRVLFNDLNEEQILHYIKRTNWSDKAGGYAIQQGSGLIVRSIDGCYYNVMGLPINTVHEVLKHFDIDLWNYI